MTKRWTVAEVATRIVGVARSRVYQRIHRKNPNRDGKQLPAQLMLAKRDYAGHRVSPQWMIADKDAQAWRAERQAQGLPVPKISPTTH